MFKRASRLAAVAMVIAAVGCSGSDGSQGPQGPAGTNGTQGPIGPQGPAGPQILVAEQCAICHGAGQLAEAASLHDASASTALARGTASILTADFTPDSATTVYPQITFQVRNAAGAFVDGWGAFNFTIAKLVPGTSTVPEHWVNFIYSSGNPSREAGGPNTSATAGSSLSFNAGTHTYTYKFGTNIAAVGAPAIAFDPAVDSTIRIGLQVTTYSTPLGPTGVAITPPYDMTNGVADFTVPAGAAVVNANAALSRDIVTTNACNKCHGKLAVHGRRVEVPYCATCHNSGLTDSNGSGDLTVFIHKLHGREKLTKATTPIFTGFIPQEITYPRNIIDCATCHQGADGARWNTNPSRFACTSCHDDITFDAAQVTTGVRLHTGGARSNDSCLGCHAPDGSGSGRAIIEAHTDVQNVQGGNFKAVIGKVTNVSGKYPAVKFSIVNPNAANAPYALDNAAFKMGSNSTLALLVGFANTDFQNNGVAGVTFGQPYQVNLLSLTPGGAANANGQILSGQLADGSYLLTIDQALPTTVTGASGSVDATVAIQGHPAYFDPASATTLRLPMKNASAAVRVKGSGSASARRIAVDINKCNDCHGNLSLHGNNRTGDITTCTICHNTEATDGSRRPNFTAAGTAGIDGKLEEGIDFKYMIHKIHGHTTGQGIVVYGFGGSVNDFREVTYPGIRQNCQACHVAGGYMAPASAANGSSTFAGADRASGTDNLRTTKYLATCGGCHDSGAQLDHVESQGGNTGLTQTQINALNQ